MTTKKLKVDIFKGPIDGNAYAIMAAFRKQAKAEGWDSIEIKQVMDEAKSGDYDHLLQTFMKHTE